MDTRPRISNYEYAVRGMYAVFPNKRRSCTLHVSEIQIQMRHGIMIDWWAVQRRKGMDRQYEGRGRDTHLVLD